MIPPPPSPFCPHPFQTPLRVLLLPLQDLGCQFDRLFFLFGTWVSRLCWPLLIATLSASFVLSIVGLPKMELVSDVELLFAPQNSRGIQDRRIVEGIFEEDHESSYFVGHQTSELPEVAVILGLEDPRSAFKEETFDILEKVDDFVRNLDGKEACHLGGGGKVTFERLCARRRGGSCAGGYGVLESLRHLLPDLRSHRVNLTYPIVRNEIDRQVLYLPHSFGGADLEESGEDGRTFLRGAKAIRMTYPMQRGEVAGVFQLGVVDCLVRNAHNFTGSGVAVELHAMSSRSIEIELGDNLAAAAELIPGSVVAVVIFSVVISLSSGQTLLTMLGLLVTVLASAGAWGALAIAGFPFQAINLAGIFLLLGIGLDDTFVMIAAWERATSASRTAEEAAGKTFSDAGISITITSLTNVAAFGVGYFTSSFRSVQTFYLFTGTAIAAVYLFTLLAFVPAMVMLTKVEALLGRRIKIPERFKISSILHENFLISFGSVVRSGFIQVVQSNIGKSLVLLCFVVYVAVSGLSFTFVEEGLERQRLCRDSSYLVEFFRMEDHYFRTYPYRIQVVFPEELNYWNVTMLDQAKRTLEEFRKSKFITNEEGFEENWIKEYETYLQEVEEVFPANRETFSQSLGDFLDVVRDSQIRKNVVLKEGNVVASRFLFQSSEVPDSTSDKAMASELRRIADSASIPVVVFHPSFPFWDQLLAVFPSTVYSVACSFFAVLCISTIFLGASLLNPGPVLVIACTVVSVEMGVWGLMAPLGINLDVISMIVLVMCVGFSVDYSAHVAAHFVRSSVDDENQRLRDCLTCYGPPVAKSATSTALGVLPLLFVDSYITQTFAKLMLAVVTVGLMHGLILLPTVLSLLRRCKM